MSGANQVVKFAHTNRENQLAPMSAIGTEFHQRVVTTLTALNAPLGVIPVALFTTDFLIDAASPAGLTGPSAVQLCQYFQALGHPINQGLNPTAINSRFNIIVQNNDPAVLGRVLTFGANVTGGPITLAASTTYELSFELTQIAPVQTWNLFSMSQNILPFIPPVIPPIVAPVEFGAFFGMTAGPGNTTPATDYPATVAISAAGSSVNVGSALHFPRVSAPAVGGIVINNPGAQANQLFNNEFLLPNAGTYRVHWHVSVDEPAQWTLFMSDLPSPAPGLGAYSPITTAAGTPSTIGHADPVSQLSGDTVFVTPAANHCIQVRNLASPAALTITPLPGGTQAQAPNIFIQRLV